MGQLDAKLKREAQKVSNAPKPVSQTKADTTTAFAPKSSTTNELDDLLVADNKSRIAQLNARRR